MPAVGALASHRLGVAVAVWELALGAWLLLRYDAFARLAALATFLAFAAVSGYYGVVGVANCGCFGAVKASPWAAFGVDLAALGLLAFSRPTHSTINLSRTIRFGLASLAMLAALAGTAAAAFGGIGPALARLRGERLALSTGYLDFGEGAVGERLTATVGVTNFSSEPLRIVGGTSDCSCTTTEALPLTIAPGETAEIAIQLRIPKTGTGQMTRQVFLWTDCPGQRTLRFRIGCRVN